MVPQLLTFKNTFYVVFKYVLYMCACCPQRLDEGNAFLELELELGTALWVRPNPGFSTRAADMFLIAEPLLQQLFLFQHFEFMVKGLTEHLRLPLKLHVFNIMPYFFCLHTLSFFDL